MILYSTNGGAVDISVSLKLYQFLDVQNEVINLGKFSAPFLVRVGLVSFFVSFMYIFILLISDTLTWISRSSCAMLTMNKDVFASQHEIQLSLLVARKIKDHRI